MSNKRKKSNGDHNEYFRELMTELSQRNKQLREKIWADKVSFTRPHTQKDEAAHVSSLFSVTTRTKWTFFDKEVFILPTKWFEKWKAYVNYDGGNNPPMEHIPPPGQISTQSLLLESKDYFHDFSCPNALSNHILRDSMEEKRDFYIVSKDIWEYLHSIYGGQPIQRNRIVIEHNGKTMLDLKLQKVN